MERRPLGQSGIKVSVIGLGTWAMGGEWWGKASDEESIRTIHHALDVGINLMDTAEDYGKGHAEEVLGRALRGRRNEAVISDKVWPENLQPERLREAFERACRRLQTDFIDVYYIHWPNPDVPIADSMGELERLRQEGKVRAIGVSNFTTAEIADALRFGRIDVIQPPYNMFWRFAERDEIPFCQTRNVGVVAYSALAQGLLTGQLTGQTKLSPNDSRLNTVLFQPGIYERCIDAVDAMRPIAKKYGKSLAQLAVNWVISRPGISSALVGAQSVKQVQDDIGAVGWTLSPEDYQFVDDATRAVFETLPEARDMFFNWQNWELQRRRFAPPK
ncbi:MAG TPA: aldo/keto reductase, partial [Chloroflexota bacterium]|nr:aldo/keto reductase [Chloroflexota bacterium]